MASPTNDFITHQSIRNFYRWLGDIADQVEKRYAWWPCLIQNRDKKIHCKAGCCHHAAFLVSEVEWNEIWANLRKIPQKQLDYYTHRAWDLFVDYLRPGMQAGMSLKDICLEVATKPFPCPLLDLKTSLCTIYDDRPILCRTFGNYLDAKNKTTFYSETVAEAIAERRKETGEQITLPDFEVVRQEMSKVIGGRVAPIPLWLLISTKVISV